MKAPSQRALSPGEEGVELVRGMGFGLGVAWLSSFGQTFFIALLMPGAAGMAGMDAGRFGMLYALATLGSALMLPQAGKWMDVHPERQSLLLASGLLVGGLLLLSGAVHWSLLLVGLFAVRFAGQGLLPLLSATTMARYFHRRRGLALGVSSVGFPLGEIVLPAVVLAGLAALGHLGTLWMSAAAVAGGWMVLRLGMLGRPLRLEPPDPREEAQGVKIEGDPKEPGRWHFFLLTAVVLVVPFAVTIVFLYLEPIASGRGWSASWVAGGFVAFGLVRGLGSLGVGWLMDACGAGRLFPWTYLPLIGALGALHAGVGEPVGLLFFPLIGLAFAGGTTVTGLLVEWYGKQRLAERRARLSAFGVFATALAPALAGGALVVGGSFEQILSVCLGLAMVAFVASWWCRGGPRGAGSSTGCGGGTSLAE